MAVNQLPGTTGEFAKHLHHLLGRLDAGAGWCAVFWQRDPEGMRACLEGRELPPWDVVEALLQDLAGAYGPAAAGEEAERARTLHGAAAAVLDSRPGARDALGDRLDGMLREKRLAADRVTVLGRRLHTSAGPEETDAIRVELAWAHDDHDRATARCAEIRARIERLEHRARRTPAAGAAPSGDTGGTEGGDVFRARPRDPRAPEHTARADGAVPTGAYDRAHPGGTAPVPATPAPVGEPEAPAPSRRAGRAAGKAAKPKRRSRGGARYAWVEGATEEPSTPAPVPESAPAPARPAARTPRGARFAGAAEAPEPAPRPASVRQMPDEAARDAAREAAREEVSAAVAALLTLRREHRSGEAHALLAEFVHWPPARIPLLAAQLEHAGLAADWATLLWEAASLPADSLVAAADALAAAGRAADGEQLLRQGVVRPAGEMADAVLGLAADGREREVRTLLDAYVRIRPPEEAVRSVEADPPRLVPLLLTAARGVSEQRHWDLVHALRVAGFAA